MSNIRGKDTAPEITVRKFLFSRGFRYRNNVRSLPGTPDIVLSKYGTVVFVHGCFWHGHKNCKAAKLPDTRKDFWKKKINGNIKRDQVNKKTLKEAGWNVIVIWQCQLKRGKWNKIQTSLIKKLREV